MRVDEVKRYIDVLKNYKNEIERVHAAKELMTLGSSDIEAVPILVETMKAKNSFVRQSVANALKRIGRPTVPALIELLSYVQQDINSRTAITEHVRIGVSWILGEMGYEAESAVVPLLRATKGMDFEVCEQVQETLRKVVTPASVPILIEALADEDSFICEIVAEVLAELTGQQLGDDYTTWKQWWDKNSGVLPKRR